MEAVKKPRGACLDMSPAIFHELAWTSTGKGQGKRAKHFEDAAEICRRCPIRAECLVYALSLPVVDGVFAGYDPMQIERMRKAAQR